MIFTKLCNLIIPEYASYFKLALTIISRVWEERHAIAQWIAAHWGEIAFGLKVFIGIALILLGGYALYRVVHYCRGRGC